MPCSSRGGDLPTGNITQNRLVISDQRFPTTTELLILHKKGITSIIFEDEIFQLENGCIALMQVNQMLRS